MMEEERERQDLEITELREKTAKLLQRWYEVGVLGWGECWEEWETRIARVEQRVRREESRREKEREEQAYEDYVTENFTSHQQIIK